MAVVVETTIGDFTVDLYTEERPQSKYTVHDMKEFFAAYLYIIKNYALSVYEMTFNVKIKKKKRHELSMQLMS